jgi:hypothetical protein
MNMSGKLRVAVDGRNGRISSLVCDRDGVWENVAFRQDEYGGPALQVGLGSGAVQEVRLDGSELEERVFAGLWMGLVFSLRYEVGADRLKLIVTVENRGAPLKSLRLGLRLGIDTCMVKFPEWNEVYFPTLLRCEKTHFWGYAMTPRGRILGLASPDPVASWRLLYNSPLHRVHSFCLDLMAPGPLPERHPQGSDSLATGERREWSLFLMDIASLDAVKPTLADVAGIPLIDCDRYTVEPGDAVSCRLFGATSLHLRSPDGRTVKVDHKQRLVPGMTSGVYTLEAHSSAGRIAEAKLTVRKPWSWYLKRARAEAIRIPQKGTSHAESWYGLFSCFGAQKHFPDAELDRAAHRVFDQIFPLMYDLKTWRPTASEDRIQNHSCAAGLLAMRYQVTGNIDHLESAAKLVDFLIEKQTSDGAYRNGGTHYTSVIYVAKSIMEVMAEEKKLSVTSELWLARYERHRQSVRRAIDNLVVNLDDIETEGEMTYEDGMISCSCLQLGMYALLLDDPVEQQKYLAAALHFAKGHRCLAQLLIPDSRMNGGTLRFWEAQYDVLTTPNLLNSPHGWSAWRLYALWYLYQLTGEVETIQQLMNGMGSCVQLMDSESGRLRWAFMPDPQVECHHFEPFPDKPDKGRCVRRVMGEQYLPMISDWYLAKQGVWATGYWGGDVRGNGLVHGETWPGQWGIDNFPPGPEGFVWGGDGGCCDNDVHEIFKCLEETVLTSAYVVGDEQGRLQVWNGRSEGGAAGRFTIVPSEACVAKIHFNLKSPLAVQIQWGSGLQTLELAPGLCWIIA